VTPLDLVQWDAGRASWSLKVGSVVSLDVTPSDLVSLDASMASLEHRGRVCDLFADPSECHIQMACS